MNYFYLPENGDQFDFAQYDYVVDAIDTIAAKIDIICRCKTIQIPVISALGCGNKMDLTKLEVEDLSKTSYDPLAKVLRRELKQRGIIHHKVVYSKETPIEPMCDEDLKSDTTKRNVIGSSSFVPPAAGLLLAQEVIKDLLK